MFSKNTQERHYKLWMRSSCLSYIYSLAHENKHKYEKCASPGAARVEVDVQRVDKTLVCVSLLRKSRCCKQFGEDEERGSGGRASGREGGRLELPAVG